MTELAVRAREGPVRWMAPESLRNGEFTFESDVWMFGIVGT